MQGIARFARKPNHVNGEKQPAAAPAPVMAAADPLVDGGSGSLTSTWDSVGLNAWDDGGIEDSFGCGTQLQVTPSSKSNAQVTTTQKLPTTDRLPHSHATGIARFQKRVEAAPPQGRPEAPGREPWPQGPSAARADVNGPPPSTPLAQNLESPPTNAFPTKGGGPAVAMVITPSSTSNPKDGRGPTQRMSEETAISSRYHDDDYPVAAAAERQPPRVLVDQARDVFRPSPTNTEACLFEETPEKMVVGLSSPENAVQTPSAAKGNQDAVSVDQGGDGPRASDMLVTPVHGAHPEQSTVPVRDDCERFEEVYAAFVKQIRDFDDFERTFHEQLLDGKVALHTATSSLLQEYSIISDMEEKLQQEMDRTNRSIAELACSLGAST